jgi:hypothetical protein
MKNSIRFFIGFSLLVLIACYGCSENSEEEMKAAQAAMDNAKSFHAEELAASNWKDAMQAWDEGDAAVKQGKPAKTFFLRARSRFEKTAAIAKARQDILSKEVQEMQQTISERIAKVQTALESGRLIPGVQTQIKPLMTDVKSGAASLDNLVSQQDYLKARELAKEIQTKIYNAELILAGKKPAP